MRKFLRIKNYVFATVLIGFFCQCHDQKENETNCIRYFNLAKNELDSFYLKKDSVLLQKSLENVNKSLKCDSTMKISMNLKVSLLSLMKKYKEGAEFVKTLNEKDFKLSYQKFMYFNFFVAQQKGLEADSINRKKAFQSIIDSINTYAVNQNSFNEEVYYDLFFVKRFIESDSMIDSEIKKMEEKYPSQKVFFTSNEKFFG